MSKKKKEEDNSKTNTSKFAVDEKELKSKTIPNPVVLGGMEEIGLTRIKPAEIPQYLLMHPALSRGIEIKANRMIRLVDEDLEQNVLVNRGGGEEAEKARDKCRKVLYDSGGPLFLKQLCMGANRFGTSFSMIQTNQAENDVLRYEYQHPIFFGPARYPEKLKGPGVDWGDVPMRERSKLSGKMKINPKTKKIAKYTQFTKTYPEREDHNYKYGTQEYVNTRTHPGMKTKGPGNITPFGPEFDESTVFQLAFDRIGDEPLGIPLVQFLQLTIKYLLNMEKAGAQTMVNFGFNKWVANTPFKTEQKMKSFAKTLSNIQKDSVVVLPENIDLRNIIPGTTEFDKIHPIYMRLLAIRLGIPMPLLVLDGTSTNKSTLKEQKSDMYDDFIADELVVERVINEAFFKTCRIIYPDKTITELEEIVPKFKFNQPPEDIDLERERDLKFSLSIRNFSTAAEQWAGIGDSGVVSLISEKVKNLVKRSMKLDYSKEELEKIEKKRLELVSAKAKYVISEEDKKKRDEEMSDVDEQVKDLEKEEE